MIFGTVAIVGRPNVGKSTLFNKLTRSQTSIVNDEPGVTRDRIYGTAYYDKSDPEHGFTVIDTGGFETDDFKFQPFAENIVWNQSKAAIEEADLVLFIVDGKHGLHQHDEVMFRYLNDLKKPTLCVVNKIDGAEKEFLTWEFYSLGTESMFAVSAAHNKGLYELLERVQTELTNRAQGNKQAAFDVGTKIALIGRPNAGKSSILNRLIGEERSLVSPIAGTTRDSIDTTFVYQKTPYVLIDTAGIRRRTKVQEHLEVQSVIRSLRAIERADVVLMVIDAVAGMTDQDARLVNLATDRFKPVLIVVNKWDLVKDKDANSARDYTRFLYENHLKDSSFIPVHYISCKSNQRVHQIMAKVEDLIQQSSLKSSTAKVNVSLEKMVARHSPQIIKKYSKRTKFYYATQVRTQPPTIVVKCNIAQELQVSYKRYMLKNFRNDLGFNDVPVRLLFRGKKETKGKQDEHTSSSH